MGCVSPSSRPRAREHLSRAPSPHSRTTVHRGNSPPAPWADGMTHLEGTSGVGGPAGHRPPSCSCTAPPDHLAARTGSLLARYGYRVE